MPRDQPGQVPVAGRNGMQDVVAAEMEVNTKMLKGQINENCQPVVRFR